MNYSNLSNQTALKEEEIDLSLIEHNLQLTPEERILEHQRALDLVLDLEEAGKKLREESR